MGAYYRPALSPIYAITCFEGFPYPRLDAVQAGSVHNRIPTKLSSSDNRFSSSPCSNTLERELATDASALNRAVGMSPFIPALARSDNMILRSSWDSIGRGVHSWMPSGFPRARPPFLTAEALMSRALGSGL